MKDDNSLEAVEHYLKESIDILRAIEKAI